KRAVLLALKFMLLACHIDGRQQVERGPVENFPGGVLGGIQHGVVQQMHAPKRRRGNRQRHECEKQPGSEPKMAVCKRQWRGWVRANYAAPFGGSLTMVSQNSSMACTTLLNWCRSIGLVMKQFACKL